MPFSMRRGVSLSIVLTAAFAALSGTAAQAGGWRWHTIPRETYALDYRTGQIMMAPAIPYGHYAADPVGKHVRNLAGLHAGLKGHLSALCGRCGLGACHGCGGAGIVNGGACGDCGGDGCGHCGGDHGDGHFGGGHGGLLSGLFSGHGAKSGHGLGLGHVHGIGGAGLHGLCGPGQPCASPQGGPSSQAAPSVQAVLASGQGSICGGCGGKGLLGQGSPCGLCGGNGLLSKLGGLCGLCGGKGLHGNGAACGGCGGSGLLGHGGDNLCGGCGGKGCGLCGGTGLKHLLTGFHGIAGKLLHKGDIEYFVGPGGPVPLTPGYVPYVVPTRSPRDYFAFPPFSEQSQP